MTLSNDDRVLVRELRQSRGYNAFRLMKEFPHKHWSKWTLNRLIKQIDTTGSADKKKNPGRKRNIRTAPNVNAVEELMLSQEEAPGTHRSTRQIAREAGISQRSVLRIIDTHGQVLIFEIKI